MYTILLQEYHNSVKVLYLFCRSTVLRFYADMLEFCLWNWSATVLHVALFYLRDFLTEHKCAKYLLCSARNSRHLFICPYFAHFGIDACGVGIFRGVEVGVSSHEISLFPRWMVDVDVVWKCLPFWQGWTLSVVTVRNAQEWWTQCCFG